MAAEQLEPRELYDPEQVRRVVENVEDPETKAILYLAWETALTATEIASLRWQDVDLVKGKLHVDWREIPMSKEMIEFLREKSRKGTYVIKSRKGDMTPMDRVSVSRKARSVLDASGLPGACLKRLREDRIIHMMRTNTVEQVSRITGCDKGWLRTLYKKCMGGEAPTHAERRMAGVSDQTLLQALAEEGDCVETRAIFLSWQGGLRLEEMVLIHWRDVDLTKGTWRIAEQTKRIPAALLGRLCQWREKETDEQPLLRGPRSRTTMDPKALSKRISFFLARHQLEFLSLIALRGKGARLEGQEMIYSIVRDRGNVGVKTVSEIAGIPLSEAQWYLDQLVQAGRLIFVKRKGYLLPGFQEPWAIVKETIAACKAEDRPLVWRELLEKTGLPANSLGHYLRRAMREKLLERTGRGVYHCL